VRTCRPLPTHAGIIIIVVIGAAVAAIFLGGGEQAPFLGLSKLGPQGKSTSSRGRTDFHDDLREPPAARRSFCLEAIASPGLGRTPSCRPMRAIATARGKRAAWP
jgi:hypothetical protein